MKNENDNANSNISLDDLYGHLKVIDTGIIRRFKKPDISDYEYIFCGLLSDLVSNAQSLLINKISANINSIGVDNNCKKIIETICILKMLGEGKISLGKAKLYRYLYPFNNEDNVRTILSNEDKSGKVYNSLASAKKKSLDTIKEVFKWDDETAKKRVAETNCFYGYLKDRVSDDIDMNKLLEETPVYDEMNNRTYLFFTNSIHPGFDENEELKEKYNELRNKNIDIVIDYVMKYLAENGLIVYNKEVISFSQDFINNPFFRNHIESASWINGAFEYIKENFTTINGKKDSYAYDFFAKLNSLCLDMFFCQSLGLGEQVLNKFASFSQLTSVNYFINSSDDTKKELFKKALSVNSRLKLNNYLNEISGAPNFAYQNDLNAIYESYYKDKYSLSLDELVSKMKEKPYFFIDKDNNDDLSLVASMISGLYVSEKNANSFLTIYEITTDLAHSSRYNFESGQILMDLLSQKAMQVVYEYIIELLRFLEKKFAQRGVKVNSSVAIDIFKDFAKNEDVLIKEDVKYIINNFKD